MVLDQHIKNPSKLKTGLEGHSFKRDNTAHQKHRFFYSVGLSILFCIKKEPMNCKLPRKFIGSASVRLAL